MLEINLIYIHEYNLRNYMTAFGYSGCFKSWQQTVRRYLQSLRMAYDKE